MDIKTISIVLHYILVLTPVLYIGYKYINDLTGLILKIYGLFIGWGILCYLCNGCPLTLLENYLSCKYLGYYFYPDYTFKNTDFYYILKNTDFYLPLVLVIILKISNKCLSLRVQK